MFQRLVVTPRAWVVISGFGCSAEVLFVFESELLHPPPRRTTDANRYVSSKYFQLDQRTGVSHGITEEKREGQQGRVAMITRS